MLRLLALLLLLTSAVSCDTLPYKPPYTELCGVSIELDGLICNDPRNSGETPQDYTRSFEKGDLCTNLKDYKALSEYVLMLRKKIAEQEVALRNCKK